MEPGQEILSLLKSFPDLWPNHINECRIGVSPISLSWYTLKTIKPFLTVGSCQFWKAELVQYLCSANRSQVPTRIPNPYHTVQDIYIYLLCRNQVERERERESNSNMMSTGTLFLFAILLFLSFLIPVEGCVLRWESVVCDRAVKD